MQNYGIRNILKYGDNLYMYATYAYTNTYISTYTLIHTQTFIYTHTHTYNIVDVIGKKCRLLMAI